MSSAAGSEKLNESRNSAAESTKKVEEDEMAPLFGAIFENKDNGSQSELLNYTHFLCN